jgi:hypothetical protein
LIVELVRTSRLSVLYAEAAPDKTALLKLGVMPLLNRPAAETLDPAAARRIVRREVVVYFDDWNDRPLAALRRSLYRATATVAAEQLAPSMRLSEILGDLGQRLNVHLIVLLDRFEDLLLAPTPGAGHRQFATELAEAVNETNLPTNFLIALNEAARPRLATLRALIPGFDDFSLKLATRREVEAPTEPMPIPASIVRASLGQRLYAMIKRALSRISARTAVH